MLVTINCHNVSMYRPPPLSFEVPQQREMCKKTCEFNFDPRILIPRLLFHYCFFLHSLSFVCAPKIDIIRISNRYLEKNKMFSKNILAKRSIREM